MKKNKNSHTLIIDHLNNNYRYNEFANIIELVDYVQRCQNKFKIYTCDPSVLYYKPSFAWALEDQTTGKVEIVYVSVYNCYKAIRKTKNGLFKQLLLQCFSSAAGKAALDSIMKQKLPQKAKAKKTQKTKA